MLRVLKISKKIRFRQHHHIAMDGPIVKAIWNLSMATDSAAIPPTRVAAEFGVSNRIEMQ